MPPLGLDLSTTVENYLISPQFKWGKSCILGVKAPYLGFSPAAGRGAEGLIEKKKLRSCANVWSVSAQVKSNRKIPAKSCKFKLELAILMKS
jgi:hypothetical protein